MLKRSAAAAMWLLMALWGWNYVSLVSGLPAAIGLLVGASLGAYIAVDPLHRVWPVHDKSVSPHTFERRDAHPSPTPFV